jgi:hypothetical protein
MCSLWPIHRQMVPVQELEEGEVVAASNTKGGRNRQRRIYLTMIVVIIIVKCAVNQVQKSFFQNFGNLAKLGKPKLGQMTTARVKVPTSHGGLAPALPAPGPGPSSTRMSIFSEVVSFY